MEDIEQENMTIKKVTVIGFFINAVLSIFKILAGFVGRSGAMIADGIHSLSDFLTDIVVLIGIKLTAQPEDKCHNYGHYKFETVATAMISVFLLIVGFEIVKTGINNIIAFFKGEVIGSPGYIALIAAGVSIIAKEGLYRYTVLYAKKLKSDIVKANAWHHRSDAFSSIGTLIGIGGAIFLGEKWRILDPIASIIVSILIFKVAIEILKPAIDVLTEKALPEEDREKIINIINGEDGVKGFHHLRTRSMGKRSVIAVHIFVDKILSVEESHDIAEKLENDITDQFDKNMVITIHIEPYDEAKALSNN